MGFVFIRRRGEPLNPAVAAVNTAISAEVEVVFFSHEWRWFFGLIAVSFKCFVWKYVVWDDSGLMDI